MKQIKDGFCENSKGKIKARQLPKITWKYMKHDMKNKKTDQSQPCLAAYDYKRILLHGPLLPKDVIKQDSWDDDDIDYDHDGLFGVSIESLLLFVTIRQKTEKIFWKVKNKLI